MSKKSIGSDPSLSAVLSDQFWDMSRGVNRAAEPPLIFRKKSSHRRRRRRCLKQLIKISAAAAEKDVGLHL
jgi:hypothetical protein